MRFVNKTIHAHLDYPVAIGLLALPFLLGLGGSHPLVDAAFYWLGGGAVVAVIALSKPETSSPVVA